MLEQGFRFFLYDTLICPLPNISIVGVEKERRTKIGPTGFINGSTRYSDYFEDYCPFMYVCMYVCMVITYSRVWINRVRLPILLVVS